MTPLRPLIIAEFVTQEEVAGNMVGEQGASLRLYTSEPGNVFEEPLEVGVDVPLRLQRLGVHVGHVFGDAASMEDIGGFEVADDGLVDGIVLLAVGNEVEEVGHVELVFDRGLRVVVDVLGLSGHGEKSIGRMGREAYVYCRGIGERAERRVVKS
jgi:hypothetical protein